MLVNIGYTHLIVKKNLTSYVYNEIDNKPTFKILNKLKLIFLCQTLLKFEEKEKFLCLIINF